jgi:formylglycine-generating enzyme required for sulfatase activity
MGDAAGAADEGPPCRVKIDQAFWITKAIITNEQFHLFDPTHDSRYLDRGGKDHSNRGTPLNQPGQPVVRVSWDHAPWHSANGSPSKTGRATRCRPKPNGNSPAAPAPPPTRPAMAKPGASTACPATRPSGPAAPISRTHTHLTTAATIDRTGRKVVRGATGIKLPIDRRDTYRLSYHWWQGVWNVGFRVVCLDQDSQPAVTHPGSPGAALCEHGLAAHINPL